MFNNVLIANRGEIACRIIKTLRKMGIASVAVYSSADKDSLHVALADQAVFIGGSQASESYLNLDEIINAAILCKSSAIHPGYGFLSENPEFAKRCEEAGIVFIGPSVSAMQAMASKQLAKQLLEKTNVPLTPGYHGEDQTDAKLLKEAERIGFPVLIKAANGGGGKGMRQVDSLEDFTEALAGARREAQSSFKDQTMLIEKLIMNPRHIEIQIMADNHGNVVHLFERDCSIQRRHQKIIEEAPAWGLSEVLREQLTKAAVTVAREIDYRGAGTVEFLVDEDEHFYFMEMNTRLQVEHPVTEMITNLDLVEWQISIALNLQLPLSQGDIKRYGHAIECRIYAEDPTHQFVPSIGQIQYLKEPSGEGLRLDSGVRIQSHISMYYDPMISKLIAWGDDRQIALKRMQQALEHYHIGGVKTNMGFLKSIVHHEQFINAQINTNFLTKNTITIKTPSLYWALLSAASFEYLSCYYKNLDPLLADTFSWQMHQKSHWKSTFLIEEEEYTLTIWPNNNHTFQLFLNDKLIEITTSMTPDHIILHDGQETKQAFYQSTDNTLWFFTEEGQVKVRQSQGSTSRTISPATSHELKAPMPATVVAILKQLGDTVSMGEPLMVLEAMKMEHTIHAPNDGLIAEIFFCVGEQVSEGSELIAITLHA